MRSSQQNQQKILDFIKSEIDLKGYPPSVREICAAKEMGISVRYVPEEEWNNDRQHEKEVLMSL